MFTSGTGRKKRKETLYAVFWLPTLTSVENKVSSTAEVLDLTSGCDAVPFLRLLTELSTIEQVMS